MEAEAETCEGLCHPTTKCDPTHPLHCCHLARTRQKKVGRKVAVYFECEKCKKRSMTKTLVPHLSIDEEGL